MDDKKFLVFRKGKESMMNIGELLQIWSKILEIM
jgi:hypothetical protein